MMKSLLFDFILASLWKLPVCIQDNSTLGVSSAAQSVTLKFHMPGIWPWKWRVCVHECLCGESESHSWNAGPLCGYLPPLSADLFHSLPKLRQTCVPTHIYSSLSPFLDKHRPSSTLKEDKSSDMLWFYVVIMAICEFWHCSLVRRHKQVDFSSFYLSMFFFLTCWKLNSLCWVTSRVKQTLL